jgi:hypothetical protein
MLGVRQSAASMYLQARVLDGVIGPTVSINTTSIWVGLPLGWNGLPGAPGF